MLKYISITYTNNLSTNENTCKNLLKGVFFYMFTKFLMMLKYCPKGIIELSTNITKSSLMWSGVVIGLILFDFLMFTATIRANIITAIVFLVSPIVVVCILYKFGHERENAEIMQFLQWDKLGLTYKHNYPKFKEIKNLYFYVFQNCGIPKKAFEYRLTELEKMLGIRIAEVREYKNEIIFNSDPDAIADFDANQKVIKTLKKLFGEKEDFNYIGTVEEDTHFIETFDSTASIDKWKAKIEDLKHFYKTQQIALQYDSDYNIQVLVYHDMTRLQKVDWNYDRFIPEKGVFKIGQSLTDDIYINFNKIANVLVGGEPGMGKTQLMALIAFLAILQRARVVIGDYKGIDFQDFEQFCKVMYTHEELLEEFKEFIRELRRRRTLFRRAGVKNFVQYNKLPNTNLERWYLIIDELGEAMEIINIDNLDNADDKEEKELEKKLAKYCRSIARLGRAVGLNLVFGTQRPDVKVLEGQTRDMFGKRICYKGEPNLSLIVLNNNIASKIESYPGRAIYKNDDATFTEMQTYFFDFEKELAKLDSSYKLRDFKLLKMTATDEAPETNLEDIEIKTTKNNVKPFDSKSTE